MTTPPYRPTVEDAQLDSLIDQLTLEQKVSVLSGGSAWSTAALPSIGLREMVLSDGPSGVRGVTWDERDSSVSFPSATALASSWDVELARAYGETVAFEARRMGVDVVLGPTINLHRSPLGGRHFEAFSEDPVLTAALAAAYVEGVQASGVGATPKHYVANDFETDRFNADVRVSARALRELYLLAFERPVTQASAWLVMSAYNSVNGTTATENDLLTHPLTAEWGFDGVVVSDWTAVRSIASAKQQQHLAMPGPEGAWGSDLVDAVARGIIPVDVIDEKVRRILRLATRVGALEGFEPLPVMLTSTPEAFSRRAAAEGMVLLRNSGALPLDRTSVASVAVIGDSARRPRIQGGGSATVMPPYVVTPLEGIESVFDGDRVEYAVGAVVHDGFAPFPPHTMLNPVTLDPGAHVSYFDADGSELYTDERRSAFILEFGTRDVDLRRASMTFATTYTPESSGPALLGFASPGTGRLFADGDLILDETMLDDSDQVQAFFAPPAATVEVTLTAGRPVELLFEFVPGSIVDGVPGSIAVSFGSRPAPRTDEEDQALIAEAVAVASGADIVIVVVGTDEASECEGFDRTDLRLPGRQDELVEAVTAANPRTIVVVNAGAPVEMPWREKTAALLLAWFPGQEFGNALTDVLTGTAEPGGRLPTTWPDRMVDAPVLDVTPRGGVVEYTEGIHIGYRGWLKAQTTPAYPFGHGLGYTEWNLGPLTASSGSSGFTTNIPVTNVGKRRGKQVVQVYASRPASAVDRPALWLVGFAVVHADPGQTVTATVFAPWRALDYWADGWVVESGEYLLRAGTSVAALPASTVIDRAAAKGFSE